MASWYVGSVSYTAITQWAALTAYIVGDIRRQLAAPAVGSERAFRCTTAGTSGAAEPTWTITEGATTNDGTAVWTEVTGQSTYGWSAASARLLLIFNTWAAAGDTIYVAGNHAETQASAISLISVGTDASPLNVYCVNQAGSVPPVAADYYAVPTGSISTTGANNIAIRGSAYISGLTVNCGSGAVNADLGINSSASSGHLVFDHCILKLVSTGSGSDFGINLSASSGVLTEMIDTPISFGATSQLGFYGPGRWTWRDTPSAWQGSVPSTTIFTPSGNAAGAILWEGLDISAITVGAIFSTNTRSINISVINCKLGAGVSVFSAPSTRGGVLGSIIISDSADTGYRQELIAYAGRLTTETTFVMDGGANDSVTPISWKVVSTADAKPLFPFACFPISVWNATTGSSVTATVEIESTATLTDADIWVEYQVLNTSGFPISGLISTAPATPLTTPANLPASSVTWNGGLGGAVKQYMQVSFTPQEVGYIRATVKVGKASQTLYINPQIILT